MAKLQYVEKAGVLTVNLIDDEEIVLRTLTIGVDEVPDEVANGDEQVSLKAYGIRKVLQERSSGATTSSEDKFESMLETADLLREGKWKSDEVRSRAVAIDPVFAQAIANLKGASMAAAVAALQALDKASRDGLRSNPAVIAEIERLRAEAQAASALDLSF